MISILKNTLCMSLSLSFCIANIQAKASIHTWTEDAFEEFADGRLDAGGQNIYVSRDGTIRTIHRYDVNDDGYLDLFFGNTHDTRFFVPPSVVKITSNRNIEQSQLPALGGNHVRTGDFNRDGFQDLVFSTTADGVQVERRFLTIIYGSTNGWSSQRCTGFLPAHVPIDIAVADLNSDGWLDISVLNSNSWVSTLPEGKNIRIYWGSPDGFILTKFHDVGMDEALCMTSADFDEDGFEDLAVLNKKGKIRLFWSGASKLNKDGKLVVRTSEISSRAEDASFLAAGDYDSDKYVDLVIGSRRNTTHLVRGKRKRGWHRAKSITSIPASHVSCGKIDDDEFSDLVLTYFEIGKAGGGEAIGAVDKMPDSVRILWGDKKGFSLNNSTKLAAQSACATAIGDMDNDGIIDILIGVYQGQKYFAADSLLYFGKGNREFELSKQHVRTEGATDVAVVAAEKNLPARAVFANSQSGRLYERVPVYVYWGNGKGFEADRKWEIPCQSGHQATAADLNADGFTDMVVVFTVHCGKQGLKFPFVGTNIFWGGADGYDLDDRRSVLREPYMDITNVADLNRDGYLDLVTGGWDKWLEPVGKQSAEVSIYYGSSGGFSPKNNVRLESDGRGQGVVIADFNKDEWLDIAATCMKKDFTRIFWGSPSGFSVDRQESLQAPAPIGIETADLNADGFLEIIVASYYDKANSYFDTGNYIFWGRPDGFKTWDSQWLPGYCTLYHAVADFDGDGFLDIFCPNYHGQLRREAIPSYLYWGSPDGFHWDRKTAIIGNSTSGAQAGDFNSDGLIDLAISCHTVWGDHKTDSKVLYNDGKRFSDPDVQYLPTIGSHYMWVHDMGHIYDRKYRQCYESSIFELGQSYKNGRLTYEAEIPKKAKLLFSVRSAAGKKTLAEKKWHAIPSGSFDLDANDRYVQYQATFLSDNGDRYPILDKVDIEFENN